MKFLVQLVVFVSVFFLMWFGLSQINWVDNLNIKQFSSEKQKQISELVLKMHRLEKKEIVIEESQSILNEIKYKICKNNNLDTSEITLHLFEDETVNAFALPGGHIVVNTALINTCENADMLASVISHEISHVYLEHVKRKLMREVGLTALLTITGGAEHMGTIKEVLYTLTSRGFDRDMEREADAHAIILMRNAGGDPKQLAMFLQKLDDDQIELPEVLQWISTHPDTKERVDEILKATKNDIATESLIGNASWSQLKQVRNHN